MKRGTCCSLLLALLLAAPALAQEGEAESAPQLKARGARPMVTIPAGTRIPLVLQNSVNTKNARAGDSLYFETVYPVVMEGRVRIPVGSFVRGSLTRVKRPGRLKGRGEIHVRFDEVTLPNGYTIDLHAALATADAGQGEEVNRAEGGIKSDTSKGDDIGTVAGAGSTGAGIGAIAGGVKGAGIGGLAGAAGGLAAVLLTRGRELELPRGATVEIALTRPLAVDDAMTTFDFAGRGSALPGPARRQPSPPPLSRRFPF